MLSFFYDKYVFWALVLVLLSVVLFFYGKERLTLFFLFVGSLLLGIFISSTDPFLNLWDEQYHALVAKNLINNPLKPILIDGPILINNNGWAGANIWLHKQPLFLWQMAASIKIFGLNEFAVRFPSVLMHALLVFFIYDVGKIIHCKKVGYYSALFFTFSYFCLDYLTGFYPTDHNDVAFLFYTFLSLWALIKYIHTNTKWYIILIGIFAGCAILNKWLTGLLVYGIWAIIIIYDFKHKATKTQILNFILSLLICVIVFVPWQLYCKFNFLNEYITAMDFNFKHISQPLEGHGGDYTFYYTALFEQFGEGLLTPILILMGFAFMIYKLKNKYYKLITIATVIILYLFFTIVKTKMLGYVMVVIPFFIIGIAYSINSLITGIEQKNKYKQFNYLLSVLILPTVLFFLLNPTKLYKHHSNKEYGRQVARLNETKEKEFYLKLNTQFGNQKCAIFNLNFTLNGYISGNFYTNYYCYNFIPELKQLQTIKNLGYKVIIINSKSLPTFIIEDKDVVKI